jgi:Low molecular weight phosphotyrosine protein phosphatase.
MAAALLKSKHLVGVEVRSAGIFAINGMDASPYAREVIAEEGLDYHHKSKRLEQEDVDWADCILTMSASHQMYILQNFANAEGKVFTLKEFACEGNGDVADPFGGSREMYRLTFAELKRLMEKVVKRIQSRNGSGGEQWKTGGSIG